MIHNFLQTHKINDDKLYKILQHFEPSTNLDIGGFVGHEAVKLHANKHEVISFEPFENNIPFFKKNTQHIPQIKLIKGAVGNITGNGFLDNATPIKDTKKGNWSDKYAGGSAVGWLDQNKGIPVKQYKLSDIIKKHVLMMKVDIQGGEYNCLLGAEKIIDEHGIDIILIEFTGDKRILDFLSKKNYRIFDCEYVQWCVQNNDSTYLNKTVKSETVYRLSNGLLGRRIFYNDRPSDIHNYLQFLLRFKGGIKDFRGQQTDLYCIHESVYEKVFNLVKQINASQQDN